MSTTPFYFAPANPLACEPFVRWLKEARRSVADPEAPFAPLCPFPGSEALPFLARQLQFDFEFDQEILALDGVDLPAGHAFALAQLSADPALAATQIAQTLAACPRAAFLAPEPLFGLDFLTAPPAGALRTTLTDLASTPFHAMRDAAPAPLALALYAPPQASPLPANEPPPFRCWDQNVYLGDSKTIAAALYCPALSTAWTIGAPAGFIALRREDGEDQQASIRHCPDGIAFPGEVFAWHPMATAENAAALARLASASLADTRTHALDFMLPASCGFCLSTGRRRRIIDDRLPQAALSRALASLAPQSLGA